METATDRPRLIWVDVARTVAILGMVVFHFARDLEIFGLVAYGTTLFGPWAWFARLVAGSFLFLVGFSLWLAHGRGIRWGVFWRRLGVIALAAAAVSAATFVAMRGQFVYFGILHCIVAASVLSLPFLRLPAWVSAVAAVAIWGVAFVWGRALVDAPWLAWSGLSVTVRPSMDLVPLIPWLAPCLLGLAVAKWADAAGRLRPAPAPRWGRVVAWPGRHALVIYLIHQPILMVAIWAWLALG